MVVRTISEADVLSEPLSQARGRVPAGAEVIVSSGVAGRFYDSRSRYVLSLDSTSFPVRGRDIDFVLTDQGMEGGFTPSAMVAAANSVARSELRAERLVPKGGVDAYLWAPAQGAKQVDLDLGPDRPAPAWLTPAGAES